MQRPVFAVLLAGILLTASAPVALGTTTRFPVDDTLQPVIVSAGETTFHGVDLSVRGITGHTPVVDEVLGPGWETVIEDFDLNLRTGNGGIRGKTEIAYDIGGGWSCSWAGQFDPAHFYFDGTVLLFAFDAHEVCHGTGVMTGGQLRLKFHASNYSPDVHAVGFWFVPGDRVADQ